MQSTLQQVHNSVLEHVSNEEIAEIEESLRKRKYEEDHSEVTIEIQMEKQPKIEYQGVEDCD